MRQILSGVLLLLACSAAHAEPVSGQGTWESTLQGRDLDGNLSTIEAWYDTTLNITWLADANHASTSGFIANGLMNWADANAWAAGLNINGITGWRLPTNTPINGTGFNTVLSNNATTDLGYADADGWVDGLGKPVSEMGHMNYVTLGNLGLSTPNDANPSAFVEQPGWGLSNTGPFSNLIPFLYWTGSALNSSRAWTLDFVVGAQDLEDKIDIRLAWAVRSGNVGAVAVPAAVDDGPIAVIDGVAKVIPVGANDTAFANPVTVTVTTPPTKGTITAISAPGRAAGMTISYTADIGTVGPDTFVYKMDDSTPASDTAIVTLNIVPDTDGDGLPDASDNCTLVANPIPYDADADGYGNACDADLNNSGLVTTADFAILRSVLNQAADSSANAAVADLNSSGTVTTADFAILRARLNTLPGPSGLACAGTVPCP